jgi:L-threonylcarbamoyladenylate synthase
MIRIVVDAAAPDAAAIERAAAALRSGGIAAIPTDTLYGLAANPFDAAAVASIFRIKSRELERALPIVAADLAQARSVSGVWPDLADQLAWRFWPGPLTLVVSGSPQLAGEVTGGGGTVGVRVPAHVVTRHVCAAAGMPLTATSANISGRPATSDPDIVAAELGAHLDLLLDAGQTPGGPPSTIVDVTGGEPRLIRAGAIPWDDVVAAAQR